MHPGSNSFEEPEDYGVIPYPIDSTGRALYGAPHHMTSDPSYFGPVHFAPAPMPLYNSHYPSLSSLPYSHDITRVPSLPAVPLPTIAVGPYGGSSSVPSHGSEWDDSSSHPSSDDLVGPDSVDNSRLLDFFLGADEIVGADIIPWPTASTNDYYHPYQGAAPSGAHAPLTGLALPKPSAGASAPVPPRSSKPKATISKKRSKVTAFSGEGSAPVDGESKGVVPYDEEGSDAGGKAASAGGEFGEEKKERNRLHSKRSRLRKKIFIESLGKKTKRFEVENALLRKYLVDKVGVNPDDVLREEMSRFEKDTGVVAEEQLVFHNNFTPGKDSVTTLLPPDFTLVHSLQAAKQNFLITNPNLPDEPIVYCSQGFLDMTGYTRDEVVGRNCRFLQGPLSDRESVKKIRKALTSGTHIGTCIVNYKKDGTAFWNYLFLSPLRDVSGHIIMNVGVQCEVPGEDSPDVYA